MAMISPGFRRGKSGRNKSSTFAAQIRSSKNDLHGAGGEAASLAGYGGGMKRNRVERGNMGFVVRRPIYEGPMSRVDAPSRIHFAN